MREIPRSRWHRYVHGGDNLRDRASSEAASPSVVRADLSAEAVILTAVSWPCPQLRPQLPLPLTASSGNPSPTAVHADSPAEAKTPVAVPWPSSLRRHPLPFPHCGHVRDDIAQGQPHGLVHGDDVPSQRSRELFCGGGVRSPPLHGASSTATSDMSALLVHSDSPRPSRCRCGRRPPIPCYLSGGECSPSLA